MEEENGEREEREETENGDTQRNSAGTRVYGKRGGDNRVGRERRVTMKNRKSEKTEDRNWEV